MLQIPVSEHVNILFLYFKIKQFDCRCGQIWTLSYVMTLMVNFASPAVHLSCFMTVGRDTVYTAPISGFWLTFVLMCQSLSTVSLEHFISVPFCILYNRSQCFRFNHCFNRVDFLTNMSCCCGLLQSSSQSVRYTVMITVEWKSRCPTSWGQVLLMGSIDIVLAFSNEKRFITQPKKHHKDTLVFSQHNITHRLSCFICVKLVIH